jgi:hypothetical protein
MEASAQSQSDGWEISRIERSFAATDALSAKIVNIYGDLRVRASKAGELFLLATVQQKEGSALRPELRAAEIDGVHRIEMTFGAPEKEGAATACEVGRECRADIAALVPAGQKLELLTEGGLIEVRAAERYLEVTTGTGEIDILTKRPVLARSEHGRIRIVFDALEWQGETLVETVTSDIRVELPAAADLVVELSTKGYITTDYSIEIETAPNDLEKRGRVRLGEGTRTIRMRSEKGNLMLIRNLAL